MSIVQLSRFFVCVVLFKRQLLYFIKSFCLCQELFYFSLSLFSSFPLPSHATAYLGYHFQNSLSTTFLIYFSIISLIFKSSSFLPIKNVPPPRLLLSSVPLLFSLLFLSDEGYLITAVFNCQCFYIFHAIQTILTIYVNRETTPPFPQPMAGISSTPCETHYFSV